MKLKCSSWTNECRSVSPSFCHVPPAFTTLEHSTHPGIKGTLSCLWAHSLNLFQPADAGKQPSVQVPSSGDKSRPTPAHHLTLRPAPQWNRGQPRVRDATLLRRVRVWTLAGNSQAVPHQRGAVPRATFGNQGLARRGVRPLPWPNPHSTRPLHLLPRVREPQERTVQKS